QIADVVVIGRRGRAPAAVDPVREVDLGHVAVTRSWVTRTWSGVPVGTHSDVPVWTTTGTPPANTRVVPTMNWAVTHGGSVVPVSAQPATTHGELRVMTGWLPRRTRGLGVVGVA